MLVWMLVATAGVIGLASWDARREAEAVLDDFADDQRYLAQGLSVALRERLQTLEHVREHEPVPLAEAFAGLRAFERPNDVLVLVRAPGRDDILATDGHTVVRAPRIARAFDTKESRARLTRDEAADLALPSRMAIAGLARTDAGHLGTWDLAVVATAQSERVRGERDRARVVLGTAVAAALIALFGGAALRRRTKELELAHALALRELESQRDEQLARAEKMATLGALAMGIAHELSTPVGVILTRAEQLASRADDEPRVRRNSELIVGECRRISDVIRGFLGLVRGNAVTLEDASPAALARNAVRLVTHRFEKSDTRLAVKLDEAAPDVSCEPRLMEQVLVNLLLNGCDAAGRGGRVELAVEARPGAVAFVVTDDGAGISDADRARVAEPFFTTKPEGTGLGLSIANEIVRHHRGKLLIRARGDRDEGRGTSVTVELPSAMGRDG